MIRKLKIYSDGASRGNPGPSAIAFMVLSEDKRILKKYSKCVGMKTNNQAEYEAMISALEFVSELSPQEVVCHMDSQLLAKQLNGDYQVKNPKLRTLWLKAEELAKRFQRIAFVHVSRENICIQEVDRLANQALDEAAGRS